MNNLAKIQEDTLQDNAKSVHNIIRAVAPFLFSDPDKFFQAHTLTVATGKNLLAGKIQAVTLAEKELRNCWIKADDVERIHIEKDIGEAEAQLQQLSVGVHALDHIGAIQENFLQKEITGHWIDKFSELARTHNESWRSKLLACALAAESVLPGSVSLRTLWVLGTLEEEQFVAFSTFLNLCTDIENTLMIPLTYYGEVTVQIPVPNCPLGDDITIGKLVSILQDVDFLRDRNASFRLGKNTGGKNFAIARYDNKKATMTCYNLEISGVMLTGVGESVASFCERKPNPLGKDIFESWLKSLDGKKCKYTLSE